jgi:hypothetical protein
VSTILLASLEEEVVEWVHQDPRRRAPDALSRTSPSAVGVRRLRRVAAGIASTEGSPTRRPPDPGRAVEIWRQSRRRDRNGHVSMGAIADLIRQIGPIISRLGDPSIRRARSTSPARLGRPGDLIDITAPTRNPSTGRRARREGHTSGSREPALGFSSISAAGTSSR